MSSMGVPQTSASPSHSRRTSTTAIPQTQAPSSKLKQPSQNVVAQDVKPEVHYTVFVRLPFPRNDFEDPPPVDWNSTKDKQLWKLISSSSNSKDLDWQGMSVRFDVPLTFLLQQAAWLYERHFEGMRAQMKKLGAGVSSQPQVQQSEGSPSGSFGMQKTGSKDAKALPSINTQRSIQTGEEPGSSSAGTPRSTKPPNISRNPSASTVTQSRVATASPRQGSLRAFRGSSGSQRRPPPPVHNVESSQDDDDESAVGRDVASDSESADEPTAPSHGRATRRPPPAKRPAAVNDDSDGDAEDDDDSSGDGYLPFAAASNVTKDDPAATLRGSPKRQNAVPHGPTSNKGKAKQLPPESSESSASSAPPPPTESSKKPHREPLSPQQRAKLEKLSPRYKKSGSEGSPSMGSSFSDLDDASVTQSALEEALMSNMQHGSVGLGSRMSSIRDALGRK